jgi:hypothetical protein
LNLQAFKCLFVKVLIATEFPPDAPGGGPAVVRQMLQGFPGEVHWWSLRGSLEGRRLKAEGLNIVSCACFLPGKLLPAKKLPKLKAWLMENFWAPLAARDLERTIHQVKPDCIWAIPHDFSIFPLYRVLAQVSALRFQPSSFKVHVSMHDFADAHSSGDRLGKALVQRMRHAQNKLYQIANTRDVICDPMGHHLQALTGAPPSFISRKAIEPEDFGYLTSLQASSSALHSVIRHQSSAIKIAYAGTILCEPEFALFVSLLEQFRHQSSASSHQSSVISHSPIELHLFGAHSYADRPWFNPAWIFEHGNHSEASLKEELKQMDWGLSLMALDDRDPIYNHYSFPAKFCTYFGAGLPVITVGNPRSSVMLMATAYNAGITISTAAPSLDELAEALFAPNAKAKHLPEILRCAREQFDAAKMREKLWEAFRVEK